MHNPNSGPGKFRKKKFIVKIIVTWIRVNLVAEVEVEFAAEFTLKTCKIVHTKFHDEQVVCCTWIAELMFFVIIIAVVG